MMEPSGVGKPATELLKGRGAGAEESQRGCPEHRRTVTARAHP